MRLAVAASPAVAIPTLQALFKSEHTLVRVISQPDRPAGRGKVLTPTSVSQWALDNNIDLVRPASSEELRAHIVDIDCVITIGYGVLLPESLLNIPPYGFLNLHFSLLPRWRGAAPVQRAIEAGDPVTGVTVFKLDAGMDTGPIFTVHRFALDSDISSDELFIELGELGVGAIFETLEKIEKGERPLAQDNSHATRALKLSRDEGRIDWTRAAEDVSAKIRAFTSNPGAWTIFRGNSIKISSPKLASTESLEERLTPGQIAVISKKVYIGTGTHALEIGEITSAGKSPTTAYAWANGARLIAGERCE